MGSTKDVIMTTRQATPKCPKCNGKLIRVGKEKSKPASSIVKQRFKCSKCDWEDDVYFKRKK